MSRVVSIRVKEDIKKALEAAGVDITATLRGYLEELAWKIEIKKSLSELDKVLESMPPAKKGFSLESVRKDREGR